MTSLQCHWYLSKSHRSVLEEKKKCFAWLKVQILLQYSADEIPFLQSIRQVSAVTADHRTILLGSWGHQQPGLSQSSSPWGLLLPYPWPRMSLQPHRATSHCPRDVAAGPVSSSPKPCPAMVPINLGPHTGPHPSPTLVHPWCLGWACPCAPQLPCSWLEVGQLLLGETPDQLTAMDTLCGSWSSFPLALRAPWQYNEITTIK